MIDLIGILIAALVGLVVKMIFVVIKKQEITKKQVLLNVLIVFLLSYILATLVNFMGSAFSLRPVLTGLLIVGSMLAAVLAVSLDNIASDKKHAKIFWMHIIEYAVLLSTITGILYFL